MTPSLSHTPSPATRLASSGTLVSSEGRRLPLTGTSLRAEAAGGLARVLLEQRFRNVHDVPLAVTYSLPLPADAAVSGFAFQLGEQRIVGEIDRRAAARERFEEALLEGQSAALLEQERSSLFTQEIGNIPPGTELVAEIAIDQRLAWLAEGAWEWRFPTALAPRYLGAPGRVPDAARIEQEVSREPLDTRMTLSFAIADELGPGHGPESPSHALNAERLDRVQFRNAAGEPLDRDVVVRWPVASDTVGVRIETARPAREAALQHAYGLLTLVPPRIAGTALGRDVVLLLDTSGSMSGEPLSQACRVLSAVVDTLGEGDVLQMIQFSSQARRWKRAPARVTLEVKRDALAWLATRSASGGTEMRAGILEALGSGQGSTQRQVLLVTDGFIGFEAEVVAAIAERSSRSTRVHTVGVGSSVNRSLTAAAARAGGGSENIIGLGEDAERAARRIVAQTSAPLVVDLELSGSAFIERTGAADLYASGPALVPVALRPEGGELVIRGRSAAGPWEQRLAIAEVASGAGRAAVVSLFGRERVEDLEVRAAAGDGSVDSEIERLGLTFAISTRLSSWIAVATTPSVDPQSPSRRECMPHALPYGVSAEALGLRAANPPARLARAAAPMAPPAPASSAPRAASLIEPKAAALLGRLSRAAQALPKASFGLARPRRGLSSMPPPSGSVRPSDAGGKLADMPAALGGASPRTLRGRVVRQGARLVLEIELDRELDWELPSRLVMEWSDGTTSELALDPARSTRPSALRAGERARLVLVVDAADHSRRPLVLRATLPALELHVLC